MSKTQPILLVVRGNADLNLAYLILTLCEYTPRKLSINYTEIMSFLYQGGSISHHPWLMQFLVILFQF